MTAPFDSIHMNVCRHARARTGLFAELMWDITLGEVAFVRICISTRLVRLFYVRFSLWVVVVVVVLELH